ncbi:hypothetical protein [Chengkuizengella axinellae]|uniref:Bypass of forespore C C-terminal domain-containing protein n=1 Tax=Chengkuizengella axinellae TaxID=3064388 RepID=A0ABT9IZ30_9BACL|nr:hypothetical protein [Chengkuizengella sp. 2205SS18-9]MDP5274050.1 hypothetical protein [Chengkuizengella sp. 2205SS18-9]
MAKLKRCHYYFIFILFIFMSVFLAPNTLFNEEPNISKTPLSENDEMEFNPPFNANDIKQAVELKNDILEQFKDEKYAVTFANNEYEVIISEEYINKWIERLVINRVMSDNTDYINPIEILQSATTNALRYESILIIAELNNVDMEKGLFNYLESYKEEMLSIEDTRKITGILIEGLGLEDKNELFFEYDVDHYTKNYIWLQLRPKYEKENPKKNDETVVDYNDHILNLYNEDINKMLESLKLVEE